MTTQGWLQRPASQWNEMALNSLVGLEESVFLEFKKASEFLVGGQLDRNIRSRELAETVSAFLNSSGGVLLIGAQTDDDPNVRGRETLRSLEGWVRDESLEARGINMTASQIIDLINGNVIPTPLGIQVSTVRVPVGSGEVDAHVVTVPSSSLGAHQSIPTKIYYKRMDDGDVPMLDYEIRDVNNRRSGPVLKGELLLLRHSQAQIQSEIPNTSWVSYRFESLPIDGVVTQMMLFVIRVDVRNLGRSVSSKFKIDIGVPIPFASRSSIKFEPGMLNPRFGSNLAISETLGRNVSILFNQRSDSSVGIATRMHAGPTTEELNWYSAYYSDEASGIGPIWASQEEKTPVGFIEIFVSGEVLSDLRRAAYWIPWRILAENMPETRGVSQLTWDHDFQCTNYEFGDTTFGFELEAQEKIDQLKAQMGIT